MKEYNWDELELKYFGFDYKAMTPQEKAKMILKNMPLEIEMKNRAQEGALELNNEDATAVYRNLINILESLPEFSSAFEKAVQKQWELRKKWESSKIK